MAAGCFAGAARGWASPLAAQLAPRQTPARTLDPSPLAPYVDALPRLTSALRTAGNTYRLTMREFAWRVHRDLPPTRGWGYDGQFPGPLIEARCGEAFSVEWVNRLPSRHFLPIDHTIHGAERGVPEVRAVVHLHGARVPPDSDGYPTAWYLPGDSRTCHYPNRQEAALLFYHDHAMGINRLNVYAGLAGLCSLRDPAAEFGLPEGEFEVPIALCDRWLTPAAQLYYPMSDDPARPWVPELFGNLVLLNGKLWPEFAAAPRAYRFRFANIANSRFFHLSLSNRHPLRVIGADQGLLAHPAEVDALLLAPAERYDVLLDFSGAAGEDLYLLNDGAPVMRIRVANTRPAAALPSLPSVSPRAPIPPPGTPTRILTLDEMDDLAGRPVTMLLNGKSWNETVTETPTLGSTEIWALVNLTDDSHPIHLHQVRFRILDRQPIDADRYLRTQTLHFTGPALPPGPEESGWKDTVRTDAGALTRILVTFGPYAGEYLWHCHLLEHEANEMMRPLRILPAAETIGDTEPL